MSDLFLNPTLDGAELVISTGKVKTTSAIETAVFLSLFTPQTWGDMARPSGERYKSRVPQVMSNTVSNRTRLSLIQAAKDALAWMLSSGVAATVDVDATIQNASRIDLSIIITAPDGDESFTYAVNWDAQTAELLEAE
jgi:phage gp46-like protein